MQKYILYSFLAIFAFTSASFGVKEDKEDSFNVPKIKVKKPPLDLDTTMDLVLMMGRPGGKSPQIHQNPDKKGSRGETFYIPKKQFRALFLKPVVKESSS